MFSPIFHEVYVCTLRRLSKNFTVTDESEKISSAVSMDRIIGIEKAHTRGMQKLRTYERELAVGGGAQVGQTLSWPRWLRVTSWLTSLNLPLALAQRHAPSSKCGHAKYLGQGGLVASSFLASSQKPYEPPLYKSSVTASRAYVRASRESSALSACTRPHVSVKVTRYNCCTVH